MTIVRLNITFSQPLFSKLTADIMLDLDSDSPFDWRNIKVAKVKDRIIWIIIRVVLMFFYVFLLTIKLKKYKIKLIVKEVTR